MKKVNIYHLLINHIPGCFNAMVVWLLCCGIGVGEELPTHYPRERTYDVLHYRIAIALDEKEKVCEGSVTISLLPLRSNLQSLSVDAAEMEIHSVSIDNRPLKFEHNNPKLDVQFEREYSFQDTLKLQINYTVKDPEKGLYFISPDSGYPNKKHQIWSQGQPEDNHYWFPCFDYPNDKATTEMIVTVNDRYKAISNGELISETKNTDRKTATYHWKVAKPYSSYLISLVVGEYEEVKEDWGDVPLSYFVYPVQKELTGNSFSKTKKAITFFSEKIGVIYPWEKYAQVVVQDFIYGGMENLSASTLTDVTIHDNRAHLDVSSDGLMAHELAHQWWGDMVTPGDWSHAWLSEGFASYFDMLFQEHDKGRDELDKMILDAHRSLLVNDVDQNRRPTVWKHYHHPSDIYDNRIYGKGAATLHMLRFNLGDDLFWKAIRSFAAKYQYDLVETDDFRSVVETETGYQLKAFFDQWVYHAGFPSLVVESLWDESRQSLFLTVKQEQPLDSMTLLFNFPVDIEIWEENQPRSYRITIDSVIKEFVFPLSSKPRLVVFDPGNHILKLVKFEKSIDEWLFQLQHANHGVDRLLALDAIKNYADSEIVRINISKILKNDPVWYVRQSAAYALGKSRKQECMNILIGAYKDRDARVRSAVISSLGNFLNDESKSIIVDAFEKDSSYYVAAAALHSLQMVDSALCRQYCTVALQRDSHREILRSTALNILAEEDDASLEMVKEFAQYGVSRDLRVEALAILSRQWGEREEIIDYLISFLNDPGYHVRRTVIILLGAMADERVIEPLKQRLLVEKDRRLAKLAQESINKIQDTFTKGK